MFDCKIIETNLSSVAYYIIKPKTDTNNTNNNKDTIKHISKETDDLLTLSELHVSLQTCLASDIFSAVVTVTS